MHSVVLDGQAVTPSKIVCIGRNYVAHIRELENEMPTEPVLFIKPNSAIGDQLCADPEEPIHYEAEITFLVRGGKLSAVGLGLDLTKRALQSGLKAKGLPWERAKAFDRSAVFSEFVSFDGEPGELLMELYINDQRVQQGSPALMLYPPQAVLAEAGSFLSFEDNDLLMTGTPAGVGVVNPGDRYHGRILRGDQVLVEQRWVAQ